MLNHLVLPVPIRTEGIAIAQMRKLSLPGVWGTQTRTCDPRPLPFPQYLGGRKLGAEPLRLYAADCLGQLSLSASICGFVSLVCGRLSVHLHYQFIFN